MSIGDGTLKIQDFTDLIAWKKGHAIILKIYEITKHFPESEKFTLTNQMTRASISITSNIAEGFGRNSAKDKIHFYAISKGSAFELRSQLHIAKDLEYISSETFKNLEDDLIEVTKLISGIMNSAQDRK